MRSLCLFAAYFRSRDLPYYITVYLKELKRHFDEVLLLCSQDGLSEASRRFLLENGIGLRTEANEGFDFGLWYKGFQLKNVDDYDKIAFVNDSCMLFRPLDEFMKWSESNAADLQGMTISHAVSTHVQSYFLVFQKSAIPYVKQYFAQHGLKKNIHEVIRDYEIGLSAFLVSKGLKLDAFIDNNGYSGEFAPYYRCVNYHLDKGMPLIKKKIVLSSYRKDELPTLARMGFNIDPDHYISLVKKNNPDLLLDFRKVEKDPQDALSAADRFFYQFRKAFIALLRPLYRLLKK